MFFKRYACVLFLILIGFLGSPAMAEPLKIIAAENFYGDIVKRIGGPYVEVINILNSPNQDPHFFSASFDVAKAVADANLIIYNGLGYDPWMKRMLSATRHPRSAIIIVADLLSKKTGENPHLWYDPKTMPLVATVVANHLSQQDPSHRSYYVEQLNIFNKEYQQFLLHIALLKKKYQSVPVIATEPVFNYMSQALNLKMYGDAFQQSIMNDIPPSPAQIRMFENNLRSREVCAFIYNSQVTNPVTQRMRSMAKNLNIPTTGVSETQPLGKNYEQWMSQQLIDLQQALQIGLKRCLFKKNGLKHS
jgi:zinc/manganese transport system substrate-binding protein